MNQNSLKLLRPMILIFILLNAFFIVGKEWLLKKNIDQEVLIVGNLILFLVSLLTFLIVPNNVICTGKCTMRLIVLQLIKM